jgi:RNA polymerase sigma factor (sigma-70 family)
MDDRELLPAYAGDKSEGAFRTLVERHLPLVYSAALRQVGNAALAQDVTQVVFTVLARKAAALPKKTVLAGWLYQTTRYTAAKALRQECRRHRREQEALIMQSVQTESEWEHWAPFLDEAMAQLAKLDREAVLLRYFRNKSLREIGVALGINEDTAQKRVSRAVDKLRHLLLKRGVAISAVALTGLLATHAAQFAPAGLGASIAAAALSKVAGSAPVLALLQQVLRQSVWPKLAMSATAALALAGLTGAVSHVWRKQPQPPAYSLQSKSVLQPRAALAVAASPTSAPQPASQPTPSDGGTPLLTANTTPQPRTGSSSLQLTPSRPMGVTNASPRAPAMATKLAFQTGLPRSANLTNTAPLAAESATNEFGSQQLSDAEWGGSGQAPFLARGGYGVNWHGLAPGQGMQVF